MSKNQKPSPDTQTNQDTDEELRELLTEQVQRTVFRSAEKRKAVEEVLLQPDMLAILEELVGDLSGVSSKEKPQESSEK